MTTRTTRAWLTAAALLAVACGSNSDTATGDSGSTRPSTPPANTSPGGTTAPISPPGAMPAPCSGKAALSGDLDWKLTVGGEERQVHVHVPKGYDRAKVTPVVLNFHALASNAAQQDLLADMSTKADQAGFIAVHPEGNGGPGAQSWNAGACCGEASSNATDDVAFVGKIIDEVTSKLCVDTRRVFAAGMSNGGFLVHRLACEMSARIAAFASVAGLLSVPNCTPVRPLSIFQFHGTFDTVVPYGGAVYESVSQTLAGWASRSGCSTTARETSKVGDVTCVTYDGCRAGAEVNLCTVRGGGHTWPGGLPVFPLGYTTMDVKATDAMWGFFVKHPLPE